MKLPNRFLITHTLLLFILILCVIIYAFVNQYGFLQGFALQNALIHLTKSLARIQVLHYILNLVLSFGGVTIFSFAAFMLGLSVTRWREASLIRGLTSFAIGEVLLSLIYLTIISLTHLTAEISGSALIISILLGFPIFRVWVSSLSHYHYQVDLRGWDKVMLILVIVILGGVILLSSARLGYDAAVEYFSNARIMAITGESVYLYPKDPFIISSFHPGILFTATIQLFGDQSARLLSWVNGVGILLFGISIGKKLYISPRTRLLFVILMLTSTFFIDLFGDGKIELIITLPILAAIYWMLESLENPSKSIFLIIGTLAGFAIISRPYNIFLVPFFIVCYYSFIVFTFYIFKITHSSDNSSRSGYCKDPTSQRKIYSYGIWFFLPLLALGIFHMWQNFIWLGNPIAPLNFSTDVNTSTWQWQFNPSILNTLRWLYPISVTFLNSAQSLGNITPLFVGFFPFLMVASVRHNIHLSHAMLQLLLSTLLTIIIWLIFFFTVVEIRYVMFLWVLLLLIFAKIVESTLENVHIVVVPFLYAIIVLLMVFIIARVILISLTTYAPIDQTGQAYCYDERLCTFFEPVNQLAPPGDRVLTLNAFDYYLRPDLFTCSSRAQEYGPLMNLGKQNPQAFWEAIYERGFDYITYEYNYAIFHSHLGAIPDPALAPTWMNVETIESNGHNAIYRITAVNPPYAPKVDCTLNKSGKWEIHSIR